MKGKIKFVVNTSDKDFTWKYGGEEATVKAKDFTPLPEPACDLFVKHSKEFKDLKGKIVKVDTKEEAQALLKDEEPEEPKVEAEEKEVETEKEEGEDLAIKVEK